MNTTPSFSDKNTGQAPQVLHNLELTHKEDLEAVLQVLVKITSRTPEQIKPYLEAMLESLVQPKERPFAPSATPKNVQTLFVNGRLATTGIHRCCLIMPSAVRVCTTTSACELPCRYQCAVAERRA